MTFHLIASGRSLAPAPPGGSPASPVPPLSGGTGRADPIDPIEPQFAGLQNTCCTTALLFPLLHSA